MGGGGVLGAAGAWEGSGPTDPEPSRETTPCLSLLSSHSLDRRTGRGLGRTGVPPGRVPPAKHSLPWPPPLGQQHPSGRRQAPGAALLDPVQGCN